MNNKKIIVKTDAGCANNELAMVVTDPKYSVLIFGNSKEEMKNSLVSSIRVAHGINNILCIEDKLRSCQFGYGISDHLKFFSANDLQY
tara:strand:+ start:139 stop:402 length:264 start_codon:yes stop_codon:yes gene_type:complete